MPSLSDKYCGIEEQDKFRKKFYIYIYVCVCVCVCVFKDYIVHRRNSLHGRKTGKISNLTVLPKTLQSVNASE